MDDAPSLFTHQQYALWDSDPLGAFDAFLADVRIGSRSIRQGSFTVYRGMFQRLLHWLQAQDRSLWSLDLAALEAFFETRKVSEQTRHRYLLVFKKMCEHLERIGALHDNPARRLLLSAKAPPREAPEVLTPQELAAVFEQSALVGVRGWKSSRLQVMIRLMAQAGLRSSEILALQLRDIALQTSGAESGGLQIRAHGPHPARWVPMGAALQMRVHAWLKERAALALPGALVFPANDRGGALSAATLFRQVRDCLQRAGVQSRYEGPTLLRNTCAAWWLAHAPFSKVQAWLGHETVKTTAQFVSASEPWGQWPGPADEPAVAHHEATPVEASDGR